MENRIAQKNLNLRFKYRHPRDIAFKRQRELWFKAQFLGKQVHLKNVGLKCELLYRIYSWLEQNIEVIYD